MNVTLCLWIQCIDFVLTSAVSILVHCFHNVCFVIDLSDLICNL
jgi:hypothetical protein